MNTHADKTQESKSRSVTKDIFQKPSVNASTFQFVDKRPAAIQMRKLQEMVNNSPRVNQLRAFSEMANNSPQTKKAAQLQAMADNYSARQQQPIQKKENKTGLPAYTDRAGDIDSGMVAGREENTEPALETPNNDGDHPIQRVILINSKKLKSRKNISQLWRADEIDAHLGLGSEEKKKFQSELLLLAGGKNITEFPGWDEAFERLKEPKILIKGDDGVVSILKNTTDLMIWLGSYPLSAVVSPRNYADTAILQRAMSLLKELKRTITNRKVWQAVIVAIEAKSSGGDMEDDWGELDLVDSVNLLGKKVEKAVPGRYKRKLPPEEYQKKMKDLRSALGGYKLVGLHATTMENTGSLVKEGVSEALFNTGHGVGKGNGFYIIPPSNKIAATIKTAKGWGSHVVAVYLPDAATEIWASEGDNVQTLEEKNKKKEPHYYMFGKGEAVIPPSLCPKIKIVVDPADISMGDTKYEAESYDDEFEFLKSLRMV